MYAFIFVPGDLTSKYFVFIRNNFISISINQVFFIYKYDFHRSKRLRVYENIILLLLIHSEIKKASKNLYIQYAR